MNFLHLLLFFASACIIVAFYASHERKCTMKTAKNQGLWDMCLRSSFDPENSYAELRYIFHLSRRSAKKYAPGLSSR